MRRLLPLALLLLIAAAPAAAAAEERPPIRSYADTSKVPIDPRTGEVVIAAARTPPDPPPESEVQDCLSRPPDPRDSQLGRVDNRFRWCIRTKLIIRNGPVGGPELGRAEVNYTAIGYGRDDGSRDIAIFFRIDKIERFGGQPPSPGTVMTVRTECRDEYEGDVCHTHGSVTQTLPQWDGDQEWKRFRVSSDDPGGPFGGVRHHEWRFVLDTVDPAAGSSTTNIAWHKIRCDSADYFHLGGERPRACVFTDVQPHLMYWVSDNRVRDIALHIRNAQDNPFDTYPFWGLEDKRIPGKFGGGVPGLHRIPSGSDQAEANRQEASNACRGQGRYTGGAGLPQPPGPGQHCDEYPFASTDEGAASPDFDFSVSAVDGSQNCAAGALLAWYYTLDRILYYEDEFFVEIRDGPPALDQPPPDTPNGGGEEAECAVPPPSNYPRPPIPAGQLRISDLILTEGDSGSQNATVTVSMSRPAGQSVSVNWTTANGTATAPDDYQARSGRLVFGPEETSKRITVPVNGDPVPEPDEHFFIRLSGASQGATIADGEAMVTIRTDPEPALSINDVRIKEDDADLTFTASLTEANNTPIGVDFATADVTATAGADYEAKSGRLDIPVGATSGTITVRTKEDFDDEIDEETFKVVLSNATNVFVTDAEGVGTIRDDDRNGLFTCRGTAARLGSTEYKVANPPEHPCRDDNQVNGLLDLRVGGIGVSLRTGAATDQTPDDLRGTEPQVGDIAATHAEATDVAISAGVNLIRVQGFVSDAAAECHNPPDAPRLSSSSRITNLTVGGLQIPVGSDPVTVPLVLATLRLNQTVRTANGITQRAIVLDQLLGPDLVLGEARAGWRGTAVHPDGHPCVV